MCHACEINRTIPTPGGIERTKTRVQLGQNRIKIAPALVNSTSKQTVNRKQPMSTRSRYIFPKSHAQDHYSYEPINFDSCLCMIVHQNLVKLSSFLRSTFKLHLPLKTNETLFPPGLCLHADFVIVWNLKRPMFHFCAGRHFYFESTPKEFYAEKKETTIGHNSVHYQLSEETW